MSICLLPLDNSRLTAIIEMRTFDLLNPGLNKVFLMISGDSKDIGLLTISSKFLTLVCSTLSFLTS